MHSPVPQDKPLDSLEPLPILQHPWSHITVDFITALPASHSNILTCHLNSPHRYGKHFEWIDQNQEIGRFIKTHCSNNQHDWSCYLPWFTPPLVVPHSSVYLVTKHQSFHGQENPEYPLSMNGKEKPDNLGSSWPPTSKSHQSIKKQSRLTSCHNYNQ